VDGGTDLSKEIEGEKPFVGDDLEVPVFLRFFRDRGPRRAGPEASGMVKVLREELPGGTRGA